MKRISPNEIIENYSKSERNFDGVESKGATLRNVKLRGASFRKSDLSWASFAGCDLTDCDFSDAILHWASFDYANLTNTNFTNADLTWCNVNGVTLRNTNFTKADLSGSLIFNVNRGGAIWKQTKLDLVAWSIDEITDQGVEAAIARLTSMGVNVPLELIATIKRNIFERHARAEFVTKKKSSYGTEFGSTSGIYGQGKAFEAAFAGIYDAARQSLYGENSSDYKEGKKGRYTNKSS